MATLEAVLDADGDGALSAGEAAAVDEVMQRADVDANGVVEVSELRRAADREIKLPYEIGHSMVVMIDANTDWGALAESVHHSYGRYAAALPSAAPGGMSVVERMARGDASLQGEDLRTLTEAPADVSLRVDFSSAKQSEGRVSLVAVSSEIQSDKDFVSTSESAMSVKLGRDYLEIAAAGTPNQGAGGEQSQISAGAVVDGNPLLRLIDRDQDQRLTTRERQELRGLLASLDRDSDGAVSAAEVPVPLRLGITLGPHLHTLLATPSGAVRSIAPADDAAPPEWFASMDKNSDRDLTREEFLGTTEQFNQFDSDGDGLLNVAEALKLNIGK
jgi:Ca2+-binding EF-hand superfamily protein